MATIETEFGTVTVVTPSSFVMTFSMAEAQTWLAELLKLMAPAQTQGLYPDTAAVTRTLNTCVNSTATANAQGTAAPTTTTIA